MTDFTTNGHDGGDGDVTGDATAAIGAIALGTVTLLEQRVLVEPQLVNVFLQTLWVEIAGALARVSLSKHEAISAQILHEYFSHHGVWADQAQCLRSQVEHRVNIEALTLLSREGAQNFWDVFRMAAQNLPHSLCEPPQEPRHDA